MVESVAEAAEIVAEAAEIKLLNGRKATKMLGNDGKCC